VTVSPALGFAFRMAWRETRGAWRHVVLFFACIAVGVAALAAVGTFGASLERTLGREARTLMGGDLEVRSSRPFPGEAERVLDDLAAAGATSTRLTELVGMARNPATGGTALVELKAVERGYPLYGEVVTLPAAPLEGLLAQRGVVVEERLLDRLGLRVGDPLVIGQAAFTVRGVVRKEPDRPPSVMRVGPRVLLASADLPRTALVQLGSRVRYRALVRLPESRAAAVTREALSRDLTDVGVRITAYDRAQPGLRRFFAQLTTYLGLVGLVSLLVGGIGVAATVRTFLRRALPTIAVLKCLGATSRVLLATYLVQTQALGVAGSLAGVILGVSLEPLLGRLLQGIAPVALESRFDPWTAGRALAMGVLVSLLFALWPLLQIRAVRPSLILRSEVDPAAAAGRRPWLGALPVVGGLAALAVWQAGSLQVGGIFVGASAAALLALAGLGQAVVVLARRLPRLPGLAWRQGVAGLRRPGGQAVGVITALGVGVMLLVTVVVLERSLAGQIDHEQRQEAPSFFFVDIQPDQREAFARLVTTASGGAAAELTPVVRSRLAAVNGTPVTRALVERKSMEDREGRFFFTRDYVLTSRVDPPPDNEVIRGHWWGNGGTGRPEISVEEEAARHLGVDLGGTLTFDVQGVPLEAEVTSLRKVDWRTFSTNFFVIFSPGALEGAPVTYVATVRVPLQREATVQDAVVATFPNVTAVSVRDILERASGILDQIGRAIRAIGFFSLGAGLVVMGGALTTSRYQRLTESMILRTLGATRGVVARAFAVEYACLGVAAGLGGAVLAAGLAFVVLRFVLDVPWSLQPATLLGGVGLSAVVSLTVGFLATYRLLGQKPLPVLRRE
jgi:putative ABC transport system permease protein